MAASFAEAQQSLLALNNDELPFTYDPTPDGVVARWKYADVKWHNYVAAGKMEREYELQVVLDPDTATWRFHEKSSRSESHASLRGAGMSKSWHKGPQKTFSFQLGAAAHAEQTDRDGTRDGNIFSWAFTTDEVKQPVVATLESLGWSSGNGFFSRLFGG